MNDVINLFGDVEIGREGYRHQQKNRKVEKAADEKILTVDKNDKKQGDAYHSFFGKGGGCKFWEWIFFDPEGGLRPPRIQEDNAGTPPKGGRLPNGSLGGLRS